MSSTLRTEGLSKRFGDFHALDGVTMQLPRGARHAVIGPNGAGKTTLINLLTGTVRATAGEVYIGSERVTSLRPEQRVRRGLVRTFQINSLFPELTVLESVLLATCQRTGAALDAWRGLDARAQEFQAARATLRLLKLEGVADVRTRDLAYGEQRLLEIALALACRPRILLLDEPAAGVPRRESVALFEAIAGLPGDLTVLFIEHDMDLVFRFAQRITVLVGGAILTEGTPQEIAGDARVKQIYLGRAA
ncbi:MAG: ABC transporter ATP-binding protein [Burkholderiales bacterium]|jgi:branched-chain amino acid transport system ATP-binding protein|nr:ABC transporter ATP-binding protein [Burkholderiales bacterium]